MPARTTPLRRSLRLLAALLLAPVASGQTTWFVDAAAPGPGSGSPSDPFASIQYAIDRSTTADGDTVLSAAGE